MDKLYYATHYYNGPFEKGTYCNPIFVIGWVLAKDDIDAIEKAKQKVISLPKDHCICVSLYTRKQKNYLNKKIKKMSNQINELEQEICIISRFLSNPQS